MPASANTEAGGRLVGAALLLAALIFTVVGLLGLVAPQLLFEPTGEVPRAPQALAELRAVYAALFLGVAGVLWRAVRRPERRAFAMGVLAWVLGGFVLGRLVSIPLDGAPTGVALVNLVAESAGLGLTLWARGR